MTVTISHLSLEPDTPIMDNDLIQRFYVEYRFLGIAPEETETPFSLPKPKPFQNLVYNFRKGELMKIEYLIKGTANDDKLLFVDLEIV